MKPHMEVLIIEDNRINLKLMTYLVQAAGIAVTTAADGERGLELAALRRPDLIICDELAGLMASRWLQL